ncbi:MAG: glycosyltransferase [Solirubrobacteraceae bacterium]
MRFCTSATVLELPHVRSLADRLDEHHPGTRLVTLLLGRPELRPDEPFDVITPAELQLPAYEEIAPRHTAEDLALLLQPHLLQKLLGDEAGDALVYLDPAHEVLAPLDAIARELERAPVLLSPRTSAPLPEDGKRPSDVDVREDGRIDPGFVALRPGEAATRFLDWWAQRARDLIVYLAATEAAGSADQGRRQLKRILDLAAPLHPDVGQLRDSTLEVSGWNLHERSLDAAASVALHGFRPDQPHLIAAHLTRVTPAGNAQLAALLDGYAKRLRDRGLVDLPHRAQVGRTLANGEVFSDRLLRLYVEALAAGEDFGDPFSAEGTERFMAWLRAPAGPGARAGISRYLLRAYHDRPDLPVAYPDLDGPDGEQFAGWAWVFGRRELDIPDAFLPPAPAHVQGAVTRTAAPSINVAGYFTGTLGLGEAARLYVLGLDTAGVPVGTRTVDAALPVEQRAAAQRSYTRVGFAARPELDDAPFNLVCVNADELPRFTRQIGEQFLAGRHNIGVWAWETDVVPRRWDESFRLLDEIWVYSRYIAENLGRVSPVPVIPIPPPVLAPEPGPAPELGLPGGFRFMFMFDFFSTVQRKNPVGVIEAFKRAFAPGEGPHLVIKTIHGSDRPADLEALLFAARDRPDVFVIDESLSVADKNGLLGSCDCYVSLHRSEGWGLPLAECMAMGKPVIATAYSGNLDFMGPGNSYLVDYTLTQVGGDAEIYPAEGTWAEPDLDDAARQMRAVFDDPALARARGVRARRDITEQLSPERAGAIARRRLEHVLEARARIPVAPVAPPWTARRVAGAARRRLRELGGR